MRFRTALAFIIAFIGLCNASFARLGETFDQLVERYGAPATTVSDKATVVVFKFRSFTIFITIKGGVSVSETYLEHDEKKEIDIKEDSITSVLSANSNGLEWGDTDAAFVRKDGKVFAWIWNNKGRNLLVISTKEEYDFVIKHSKEAEAEKTKGL